MPTLSTSQIQVIIDLKTKKQAQKILENLGKKLPGSKNIEFDESF